MIDEHKEGRGREWRRQVVIFLAFLQRNGMVAVVILAVFAVRALLRKCPKKYSYALWAIVWNPYVI